MVPVPVPPRPSRVPSVVNAVAGTFQVLVLLAALAVVCAHFAVGLGLQRVLSDSMRPTFAAGNHLVVVDRAPADLRVGDVPVLMFSDGSTRAHRIVDLHRTGGSVSVLTRGDANTVDDSWTDVADGRLVPVAVATLPAAPGAVSTGLRRVQQDPLPAALLLGLGAIALTGWTMRRQYLLMRSCTCPECLERRAARTPTENPTASTTTSEHRSHQETR